MGQLDFEQYVRCLQSAAKIDEGMQRAIAQAARDREQSRNELSVAVQTAADNVTQAERCAEDVLAEAISALEYVGLVGALPRKRRPVSSEELSTRSVEEYEQSMWRELNLLYSLARQLHETSTATSANAGMSSGNLTKLPVETWAMREKSQVNKKHIARRRWTIAAIIGLVTVVAVLLVLL